MEHSILLKTYNDLFVRFKRIDFDSIWPGFKLYPFALYADEQMCFNGDILPKPDHFFGNTAIEHEGDFIAIWMLKPEQIETEDDLDRLAALLVHEMFHVMQRKHGESRFPRDLELLTYPLDERLVALTNREIEILNQFEKPEWVAADLSDTHLPIAKTRFSAVQTLFQIARLRLRMIELTGGADLNRWRVETVEGLAEHAGYCALEQLNKDLAEKQIKTYKEKLREKAQLFDQRGYGYYSGVLLARIASIALIDFELEFSSKKTLWEIIEEQIVDFARRMGVISTGVDFGDEELSESELSEGEAIVERERKRREELLQSFQERFSNENLIEATICGYDPMNLTRVGDYFISTSFLMIDHNNQKKPLMGDLLVRMKAGDCWHVEALYE